MNMKKIILMSSVVAMLVACAGSGNGELIGVQDRASMDTRRPIRYGLYSARKLHDGPF